MKRYFVILIDCKGRSNALGGRHTHGEAPASGGRREAEMHAAFFIVVSAGRNESAR